MKKEPNNLDNYPENSEGFKYDPQERNPKLRAIIKQVEKEAEDEVAKRFGGKLPKLLGICHSIWDEKKRILKEKHNIDWKTPAELNPLDCFD